MTLLPETLRALTWDGCLNARDTGGYPAREGVLRYGVLLRSDNLCRLTDAGRKGFAASKIGTIIDVRSAYELDIDSSPFAESASVHYLNLPLLNESDTAAMARINSDIALPDMYRVMLKRFGAKVAAIVKAVAAADGVVVIHCHAGKDRTGLVIALLLAAVGVGDEAIAADYAVSSYYLGEARRDALFAAAKLEERHRLAERLSARAETMLSVLDWLRAEHGGAEAYLLTSGVSETALEKLRQRLVAPRGAR